MQLRAVGCGRLSGRSNCCIESDQVFQCIPVFVPSHCGCRHWRTWGIAALQVFGMCMGNRVVLHVKVKVEVQVQRQNSGRLLRWRSRQHGACGSQRNCTARIHCCRWEVARPVKRVVWVQLQTQLNHVLPFSPMSLGQSLHIAGYHLQCPAVQAFGINFAEFDRYGDPLGLLACGFAQDFFRLQVTAIGQVNIGLGHRVYFAAHIKLAWRIRQRGATHGRVCRCRVHALSASGTKERIGMNPTVDKTAVDGNVAAAAAALHCTVASIAQQQKQRNGCQWQSGLLHQILHKTTRLWHWGWCWHSCSCRGRCRGRRRQGRTGCDRCLSSVWWWGGVLLPCNCRQYRCKSRFCQRCKARIWNCQARSCGCRGGVCRGRNICTRSSRCRVQLVQFCDVSGQFLGTG